MEPKKRILVVDDEPIGRRMVCRALRPIYDVTPASDGQEGLECALALPGPDMILADVQMPGLDGVGMIDRLRETERGRKIPVIFLTGRGSAQGLVDGYRAGARYYLTKPITLDDLLSTIEAALQGR